MTSTIAASYAERASEYVAGRPEYPAGLLSDLPSADTIIDLGAGTGKFTRLLALTGSRVLAIEPLEQMAVRIPVDRLPGVEVLIGRAEAIPVRDGLADLVCCATAFHWFDYERATEEILRVLAQDGALALVWNVRDDRVPWVAAFSRLLDSYAGETPRQSSGRWRVILDDLRFRHLASSTYPLTQPMPPAGILDRALSTSFIAALSPGEHAIIRDEITRMVENEPSLRGKDEVLFPYVTELHVLGRRG
jgi:SAM-dependent methyltransferase